MFWTVAFWVLLPFLALLLVMVVVASVVKRRRYQPGADDWQDWKGRAAQQRAGTDRFDVGGW